MSYITLREAYRFLMCRAHKMTEKSEQITAWWLQFCVDGQLQPIIQFDDFERLYKLVKSETGEC